MKLDCILTISSLSPREAKRFLLIFVFFVVNAMVKRVRESLGRMNRYSPLALELALCAIMGAVL